MNTQTYEADSKKPEELELCISCLQPNEPGNDFCAQCRTPLTSYASTDPIYRIHATGDFLRKAVSQPRWNEGVRALIKTMILLTLYLYLHKYFLRHLP